MSIWSGFQIKLLPNLEKVNAFAFLQRFRVIIFQPAPWQRIYVHWWCLQFIKCILLIKRIYHNLFQWETSERGIGDQPWIEDKAQSIKTPCWLCESIILKGLLFEVTQTMQSICQCSNLKNSKLNESQSEFSFSVPAQQTHQKLLTCFLCKSIAGAISWRSRS